MEKLYSFDLPHGPGNPRNSEGAFLTLKDGSLIFAWSRYQGTSWHDDASADIALIRSADLGKTWSVPEIIVPKGEALNVMSTSLLRLQNGRIMLGYLKKESNRYNTVTTRFFVSFSDDEAKTWTEPVCVTQTDNYYVVNNDRLVQLQSGRIAFPAAVYIVTPRKEGCHHMYFAYAEYFYSDDNGQSWQSSLDVVYPPSRAYCKTGWQEPGIIELEPNRLMMWMRTDYGYQCKCYSEDGGMSWSVPELAKEFPSPISPLSMKRDPRDNSLVAVWNDAYPRWGMVIQPGRMMETRTPLVMAISRDNARTWEAPQLLENEPLHAYCYSAIHFQGDLLFLAYCCGVEHQRPPEDTRCCLQDLRILVLKK